MFEELFVKFGNISFLCKRLCILHFDKRNHTITLIFFFFFSSLDVHNLIYLDKSTFIHHFNIYTSKLTGFCQSFVKKERFKQHI